MALTPEQLVTTAQVMMAAQFALPSLFVAGLVAGVSAARDREQETLDAMTRRQIEVAEGYVAALNARLTAWAGTVIILLLFLLFLLDVIFFTSETGWTYPGDVKTFIAAETVGYVISVGAAVYYLMSPNKR